MEDLLYAHGILMHGLNVEFGVFSSKPVGVVDAKGNILHFGILPPYTDGLISGLLERTKTSELHMLIKNCVFH